MTFWHVCRREFVGHTGIMLNEQLKPRYWYEALSARRNKQISEMLEHHKFTADGKLSCTRCHPEIDMVMAPRDVGVARKR